MLSLLFFSLALQPAQSPAQDGDHRPVVIELFTSQGCGLCPSANTLLRDEAEARDDIIAIAYGVTYWDMFGWEDEYARPEFMARQEDYVTYGEPQRVFTPHFVINGSPQMLRFSPERISREIEAAEPTPHRLSLTTLADGSIELYFDAPSDLANALVWLVGLEAGERTRRIDGGSNSGIDMVHYNMAVSLTRLTDWQADQTRLTYPDGCPVDLTCAVLIQSGPGGPVIAAATQD